MINAQIHRMYINCLQVSKLPGSVIVRKNRRGFLAELKIRDGKYTICIDYKASRWLTTVNVYLLEPDNIDMSASSEIHTFGLHRLAHYERPLPKLCLTHHKTDKWDSSIPLTESYIPWAIEWTVFYETWLLTGNWYGVGIHLDSKENEEEDL